jgi:hypothetical protein
VALAAVVALAVPWGTKADPALATPAAARAEANLSIAQKLDLQGDPTSAVKTQSVQVGGRTVRPRERLVLP